MESDIEGVIARIEGLEPGPNMLVFVAVHGNEKCGIDACERVLPRLNLVRGSLTIVVGNPKAVVQGVRYTEVNLNRMFRPDAELPESLRGMYEYERSRELMPLIESADAVLDIHSSGTPDALPFVICANDMRDTASLLNFPIVSSGWAEVEPGGTDDYAESLGVRGFCAECGYHSDMSTIDRAEDVLLRFLALYGVIGQVLPAAQEPEQIVQMTFVHKAKVDFVPTRAFRDFDPVSAGEVIGTDGGTPIVAPEDGVVVFVRARQRGGDEAFVFGKVSTAS